jgi:hypothetical protein
MATELNEPIRPSQRLVVDQLAVLPVTADAGSEDAIPLVTEAVQEWLAERPGEMTVVSTAEARERIGRGGLAPDLARVFADYDRTGVADPAALDLISEAAGAPWLLQLRIGYAEQEVMREDPLSDDVSDERRRDVRMIARFWHRGETAPKWEGTARAGSETGLLAGALPERAAMLREVTLRLLDRAPLR